jgi:16S rRNA (guanine966-N2)-methyltransferase
MRVVAGALGGRRLLAPPGQGTRPTSERVREALFSSLGEVADAVVLDLYAGSGALGIEALSRGAEHVVFVESNRGAQQTIQRNLKQLGLAGRSRLLGQTVAKSSHLLVQWGPFDLVFADPPYRLVATGQVQQELENIPACLGPKGRLVLEHAHRDSVPEFAGLERQRVRRYGDTALSFFQVLPPA